MDKLFSRSGRGRSNPRRVAFLAALVSILATAHAQDANLDRRLLGEDPSALIRTARIDGDARRGAILFHGAALGCAKCHIPGKVEDAVGPDLTAPAKGQRVEDLVLAVLDPSRTIREGYETTTIATNDGRVISGVRRGEKGDQIELLDASEPGKRVVIAKSDIQETRTGGKSSMPEGLVNNLASEQEFLDLLRYLVEITEGGAERGRLLKPSAFELAPAPLPAYEANLDHARLLSARDDASLERGRTIYERVCATCHGAPGREGSLPSSPKFWSDRLKCEGDPLRMYQVITRGQGLMPPQAWLVPRQKYDVIHYIRDQFFKPSNPAQYKRIDATYLASLPQGSETGPEPTAVEAWAAMDYGKSLSLSVEVDRESGNFAYKGIAIRLDPGQGGVARGHDWVVYDHDTMQLIGAWSGTGFSDWRSINFNGEHEIHPATVGRVAMSNRNEPAWANPRTGRFDDPRVHGRDGVPYGPLPREWLQFRGRYEGNDQVVLAYTVGDVQILESPSLVRCGDASVFVRNLQVGPATHDLRLRIAGPGVSVALRGDGASLERENDWAIVTIPAHDATQRIKILISGVASEELKRFAPTTAAPASIELSPPDVRRWPEVLMSKTARFDDEGPFGIDVFTLPDANPWNALVRPTGFDFIDDGRAALVCTWDGDVWRVDGLLDASGHLEWRRIAAGLFQPLGLKVIKGKVYVGCRDQIVILNDANGDGETDFYECFNTDHQVTPHFHEFAMGLQTDAAGNLYYAKAARHGKKAIVPQHGTLLQVTPDGSSTNILARGFRAPNGVCVNDDGTFFVTDQEGHWIPKNRLNWIHDRTSFYGNMWAYSDVTDTSDAAMRPPVCWLTNTFDRSPSEPLWAAGDAWKELKGSLLSLSYGYGQVYVAPHEVVDGVMQGAMAPLPLPRFPTGLIRGRYNPADGQLYVCGMYSWAGSQTRPGGFFRIRATERPIGVPVGVHARPGGLDVTFSSPLDPQSVDKSRVSYRSWALRRTENYGSPHLNEKSHEVTSVRLSEGKRMMHVDVDGFAPTPCYELRYDLRGAAGNPVSSVLDGTVHRIGR